jgi:SNF2 family DNA or RNA helicase
VAKLALEFLARQRFIPSLKSKPDGTGKKYYSLWQLARLDPTDAERVSTLARAMPPACRAFLVEQPGHATGKGAGLTPTAFVARALVENFLGATVDQAIRQWLALGSESTERRTQRTQGRRAAKAPVADKWINALASEDPAIEAPAREIKVLLEAVEKWTADLRDTAAAFRTCFRLEPPPEKEEVSAKGRRRPKGAQANDWTLRFFLQASDDRSLLVPADRVWQERGSGLTFLNRRFEQPQERLLGDLGRASRLFPPIETSLQSARPETCYLATEQAYTFLREAAPLFEESGLGVLVPPWWGDRKGSLGVRLRVRPKTNGKALSTNQGILGLGSIVNYEWQLAMGGEPLTWEEFNRLAELKVPLVRIRGRWVEFKPEEAEAAIEMWEKQRHQGEISLGEALRLGLDPQGQVAAGLPVVGVEAGGWIDALSRQLAKGEKLPRLATPSRLQGELRPYQVRGFSWLAFLSQWGLGACLADDMGLGKTIQFIALLLRDREGKKPRSRRRPVLMICPTSVVGNWQREVARFGPSLRVMVHHGAERASGEELVREVAKHDLVISTYSLAHRDAEELAAVPWEGVALDEAQNIKNPTAKQTQAIRRLKGDFRVALTGTPVENRLGDLWSIMEFLNPGFLGSAADFRRRFAIPIERYQDSQRSSHLKSLVQPFMLRRLKTDKSVIRDLPEKLEMKVFCNLTREQGTLYEAVLQDMMHQIEQVEGMERRGLVLATLLKLKQVCNHPAQFLRDGSPMEGRSGKLERLVEMLEEVVAAGDRALIFTQFSEMGERLKGHLESVFHRETLFLHGGVRRRVREQMVDRFQEGTRGPPFFILSIKAGGVGLNLTGASHVFHFDRWWNPAVENQATDRAYRIGQLKNVQVHKFICSGTMEDRIDELIESKQALAENIVGAGEGWLTELSTDELRDIFTLRRETVSAE